VGTLIRSAVHTGQPFRRRGRPGHRPSLRCHPGYSYSAVSPTPEHSGSESGVAVGGL